MPDVGSAKIRLGHIVDKIKNEDDLILLDSRAGFDELIAATHSVSDATICVEEEDQVARITAENLIGQLEEMGEGKPIYRLVNKARREHNPELRFLGAIPFDMDVMANYGKDHFWVNIKRSLLEPALVRVWNGFCRRERLAQFVLESTRRSPFPFEAIEKATQVLTLSHRVMLVYGIVIGITGILFSLGGMAFFRELEADPVRLIGLIMGAAGILLAITSVLRRP
jgi:septum site-determining protein MinD